jgi:branched-chain amino acid transport system ATP-binding protein
MDERASMEKAKEVLDFLDLISESNLLAKNLPYGKLRLLEMAIALCLSPKLLLLDEPAAGMNPEETERLMTLIQKIRDQGITVLLVEHNMRLVMGISDRVLAMDHGCQLICGTPSEVANDEAVIEAYLGGGNHAYR